MIVLQILVFSDLDNSEAEEAEFELISSELKPLNHQTSNKSYDSSNPQTQFKGSQEQISSNEKEL